MTQYELEAELRDKAAIDARDAARFAATWLLLAVCWQVVGHPIVSALCFIAFMLSGFIVMITVPLAMEQSNA